MGNCGCWPSGCAAAEPVKFWLSNLPEQTLLEELVRLARHRWIVERDYLELKQELGHAWREAGAIQLEWNSPHKGHSDLWHVEDKRPLVAGFPSSCGALPCGVRVPGGREEPFFAPARAARLELSTPAQPQGLGPRGSTRERASVREGPDCHAAADNRGSADPAASLLLFYVGRGFYDLVVFSVRIRLVKSIRRVG